MSVVVVDQSEDEEIRKIDTKSSSVLIWWLFRRLPCISSFLNLDVPYSDLHLRQDSGLLHTACTSLRMTAVFYIT
jgi:hypothetical protein